MSTRSVLDCGSSLPLAIHRRKPWNRRLPSLRDLLWISTVKSARRLEQSKTSRHLLALLLFSIITSQFSNVFAQYSVDWFTIDGGGGISTGGVYSVSGTIGQTDSSATLIGGSYSLTGGFWPGLVVPSSTGTPTLFIQWSGGNVIISWSPNTPGFVLEETTSLVSPSWEPAPAGNPTAPIPATGQVKFYRMRKQ